MSEGKELANWEEKLAAEASSEAATATPSSSTISLRSGLITYEGQEAPDNKLDVIVLGSVSDRTWYEEDWDPDNLTNPTCFAIGEVTDDLVPHEDVPDPQHHECETCPKNAWGSAGGKSRGKACSEKRRLIVIPASATASPEAILKAEVATLKVPVTSVKNWEKYQIGTAQMYKRPTWAVITTLSAKPDPKTQFKATFEYSESVDEKLLGALDEKRGLERKVLMKPYDMSVQEEAPEEPKSKSSKHKG